MKKLAVIGHPVSHSLSPVMHNAAIRHAGLDLEYYPIDIKDIAGLPEFLEKARGEYLGFNVTVPYKNSILPMLDTASPEVKLTGSVNTVINRDGCLHGESTDGYGISMALRKEFGIDVRGCSFFFIGSGGAAQAASSYLLSEGASSVLFANRTVEKAEAFAARLKKVYTKADISCCLPEDKATIGRFLKTAPVVIQSTSLGLRSNEMPPVDISLFHKGLNIFEMIYRETLFLKTLRENGCRCADGRLMLLYQGAKAFSLWTDTDAPVEVMKAALFEAIKQIDL